MFFPMAIGCVGVNSPHYLVALIAAVLFVALVIIRRGRKTKGFVFMEAGVAFLVITAVVRSALHADTNCASDLFVYFDAYLVAGCLTALLGVSLAIAQYLNWFGEQRGKVWLAKKNAKQAAQHKSEQLEES